MKNFRELDSEQFDYDLFDFKFHGRHSLPPGFMVAYDASHLDEMLEFAGDRIPRSRIHRRTGFAQGSIVIAAYTPPIPYDYEVTRLASYEDQTSKRFQLNIGYVAGYNPIDAYSPRIVLMRAPYPPPEDLDVSLHFDNKNTEHKFLSLEDCLLQIPRLVSAHPVSRAAWPFDPSDKKLALKPGR